MHPHVIKLMIMMSRYQTAHDVIHKVIHIQIYPLNFPETTGRDMDGVRLIRNIKSSLSFSDVV